MDGPTAFGVPNAADSLPDGIALTVAAVARRLGVAPATLRTWDRRYGLGPSQHAAGAHRRYTADDVARLERMRSLVFQGVAPADAAREALKIDSADLAQFPGGTTGNGTVGDHVGAPGADSDGIDDAGLLGTIDGSAIPLAAPSDRRRVGGGRIVPLHGGSPQARGLARAALALDATAIRRLVARSLADRGTIWTWDHLLAPVLIGVGDRFESTGQGVDLEHLLSEAMLDALRDVAATAPDDSRMRPVLLASAPEEMHTLPLHAVAAALAERSIPSRMLGARMPADALTAAVARSGPSALMLWSHDPITGDPDVLQFLPALRPAPQIVVGGPGWPERLPAGVARVTDLSDAVRRLSSAVHGLG